MESNLKYKFAAHERLFRLITNTTTVFLTGWVALITWRKGFVGEALPLILWSWSLHIFSILLVSLGDISIMLQSRIGERVLSDKRNHWFNSRHHLKSKLVGLRNEENPEIIKSIIEEHSKEFDQKVDTIIEKRLFKKADLYGQLSWWFGFTGGTFFFLAIIVSLYSIVKYLQLIPKG